MPRACPFDMRTWILTVVVALLAGPTAARADTGCRLSMVLAPVGEEHRVHSGYAYTIRAVDSDSPRRLGRMLARGRTDDRGIVALPDVPCAEYTIVVDGTNEEPRTILALYERPRPQTWIVVIDTPPPLDDWPFW